MSEKRETRRLGYALVGAGAIAGVHAEALSQVPEARLVAVYNRTAGRARALGERWQIPWTTDYDSLLARPEVEVVSICTASGARVELARKAAEAGKHVVCEKPLEVTLERADTIIQACEEAGVQLGVIFEYRFFPATLAVKKAVEAQRLGHMVLAATHVPWYRTDAYYASGAWRATWALDGGGALMNQSIHWIDLLLWMGGDVSKVHGFITRRAHPQIEVEDVGVAILQFQGGALGTIQGTTGAYPGSSARVELYGDRGTIVLQERQIVTWKLADGTPEEEARMLRIGRDVTATGASDPLGIGAEGHRLQFTEVTAAILAGHPPSIDGYEGRKALALILAIYRSNTITDIMPPRDA
jgi:UDP-N-acetyl-2-amino-2-deoxyglucuronate dehydrogenase